MTRDDASSKYDALPRPEHFEDMVRFAALLVGYQKAWHEICSLSKHKVECKKKLIKWMLVTNLYDKLSLEPDLELLRGFVSVLGDGTIGLASEKLPDYDPIVNGQLSYHMPPEMDPSLPREPMQIIMASKNDPLGLQFYKFHIFVKSMGQSFFTEKDFSHFRSLLGGKPDQRSYAATQTEAHQICLPDPTDLLQSLNSKEETKLKTQLNCFPREKWTRFTKTIDALPLAQEAPLSRESILQEFDKKSGTQYATSLCCQTNLASGVKRDPEKRMLLDPGSMKDPR
ncbi:MAG: hypothetical protein M3Q07_19200, partial [Pseudobdellovibrionaceae bacterium]|nr:hypothetical protein [Pseudobdellovibrionaceae bacterium]